MTKKCSKCGRILPIESFAWRNKAKGTLQSHCRDCQRNYDKNLYDSSPERRKKIRQRSKNDAKKTQDYIKEYKKQHPCIVCGENRWYLLDFHHINNNKEKALSRVKTWSIAKTQQEIDKCAILCANCHRDFHWQELNYNISFDQYINRE